MSNYFDLWPNLTFIRQCDGAAVPAAAALRDVDYLLLYFGPTWHPASRRFTAQLKRFHEQHATEKRFEVLFISRRSTQAEIDADFLSRGGSDSAAAAAAADVSSSSSCSPPAPADAASATASRHGRYFALAEKDMEAVAVPLLYHFRVFSYPSVLVVDNRPATVAALRSKVGSASAFVSAGFSPLIQTPNSNSSGGGHLSVAGGAAEGEGEGEVERTTDVRTATAAVAAAPPPATVDVGGRRRYTPRIERAANIPRVVTIAGSFMIEKGDPTAEHFPWERLGGEAAANRRVFLSVAVAVLSIVVYVLVRYVIPALIANDKAVKEQRRAQRAARLAAGRTG